MPDERPVASVSLAEIALPAIAPADLHLLAGSNFGAILADPPWRFATWSDKGRDRAPDDKSIEGGPARLYETMSIEDIAALPVATIAAKDCVLFLWTTWAHLFHSHVIIERWGFEYKTCAFVWTKADTGQLSMFGNDVDLQMGMGRWTRLSTEPCLLATRGSPKRLHADVHQEPRREHSRKPDCVHDRIERLVAGPFIELFARRTRRGWTCWGDEIPDPGIAPQPKKKQP
jgi:N6-adenosine-specific RNA methylase IME4